MPWRKEQLLGLGDGEEMPTEVELLAMDDAAFTTLLNARKVAKLDWIEAEQKAKDDAARIEKEKEEAAAKAVEVERERAAKEAKEKEEREAKAAKAKEEKEAAEALDAANKAIAEQEKTEKNKKYQAFLKKAGYTEETKEDYKIVREGDTFKLFKLVDTVTIK